MSKYYSEDQVNELRRALRDIRQWNEDLEDEWGDAGNRANDALRCFEKIPPIELPTDEERDKKFMSFLQKELELGISDKATIECIEWYYYTYFSKKQTQRR